MYHNKISPPCRMIIGLLIVLLIIQGVTVVPSHAAAIPQDINIPITVKECAMTGTEGYTITAVVPFNVGQQFSTDSLYLTDSNGQPVLAQFEIINKWWATDNSLKHVAVHFQPRLNASSSTYTEEATYHLRNNASVPSVTSPLQVTETDQEIIVQTGPLKFTVSKTSFTIVDSLYLDSDDNGSFSEEERIIQPGSESGGLLKDYLGTLQKDQARQDFTVTIEENGPVRTVLKAESKTNYTSTEDFEHGWAVRLYAYADQPYIKVDYQLQNSDKDVVYAWPLYFEEMKLNFDLDMEQNGQIRVGAPDGTIWNGAQGTNTTLAQTNHNTYEIQGTTSTDILSAGVITNVDQINGGFMDVSDGSKGVTSSIRHFWQMWPNGLSIDEQNNLSVELFPQWSAQWNKGGGLNDTGLYWLEDMQHVYKEVLLNFHNGQATDSELRNLVKTFECPPVATMEPTLYEETKATLDLGGVIPANASIDTPDIKVPKYPASHYNEAVFYGFNWSNFGDPEPIYRAGASTSGGWPYSAGKFLLSGNPADYYQAEEWGIGELNVRPQWLAGYDYEDDNQRLRLTENPYFGGFWRASQYPGITSYDGYLAAPRIEGTERIYKARDDQHAWFGHAEESYYITGNPWIKDWYEFVGEFRKIRVFRQDPYPDTTNRATGHSLDHLLQAYRVTGDLELLEGFSTHLKTYLRPEQDPQSGIMYEIVDRSGSGFQTGYYMRTLVDYLEIVKDADPQKYAEAFQYMAGFMEWNYNLGNFPYYHKPWQGTIGASSGTGLTLVDPQSWFYLHTGQSKYFNQVEDYLDDGINGGERPFGNFSAWQGQYESRYYHYVKDHGRTDYDAPNQITNLVMNTTEEGVVLSWTEPVDTARYHILYSNKPIQETYSLDVSECNWWAADVVVPDLTEAPNTERTFTLPVTTSEPLYVRLLTFDENFNMSTLSNQVESGVAPSVEWAGWDYNGEVLPLAGYELLVDFGTTEDNTDFGRYDWTNVFKDQYTDYRSYGGGGTCIVIGDNSAYNYQGISGSDVAFKSDDGIKVVWYNHLDETITFTPNISFDDDDRIRSGVEGTWYPMTEVTIQPKQYGITTFTFTDENQNTYDMVNVNANFSSTIGLMCDKIFFCTQ